MTQIRPLNKKKYDLSKKKFLYVLRFAYMYPEWKRELKEETYGLSSVQIDGMPKGNKGINQVQEISIKRKELEERCKLIEQTAISVAPDFYQELIFGATNEGITYAYLNSRFKIPCGRNLYYERRRKFYYELSKAL